MGDRDIRFYGSAVIGARGQVAVPARLRRELALKAGDQVLFVRDAGEPSGFQICLPDFALQGRLPTTVDAMKALKKRAPTRGSNPDLPGQLARVRSIELFRDLDPVLQQSIAALLRGQSYQRGEIIAREGEPCEALYMVASGRVKRVKLSPDGKEQILKIIGPGDSFNEVPVLDGGPNPAGAEALEPSVVDSLARADFLTLLQQSPPLAATLVQVLGKRTRHLVQLVEDLSLRDVTGRLARLLSQHADAAGRLTQQEMAAMVGTVREVIGRALHELEHGGAIQIAAGRVTIISPERLKEYVRAER